MNGPRIPGRRKVAAGFFGEFQTSNILSIEKLVAWYQSKSLSIDKIFAISIPKILSIEKPFA